MIGQTSLISIYLSPHFPSYRKPRLSESHKNSISSPKRTPTREVTLPTQPLPYLTTPPQRPNHAVLPTSTLNPDWELDFNWAYLPPSSASTTLHAFYNHIIEPATSTSDPMGCTGSRVRGVPGSGRVSRCGACVADCEEGVYEKLSLFDDERCCWGVFRVWFVCEGYEGACRGLGVREWRGV